MRQLTQDEAQLFTQARSLLTSLANAAEDPGAAGGNVDGYRLGLMNARCVVAEGAIFDVLNCLSSYGNDPEAKRVLHPWKLTADNPADELAGETLADDPSDWVPIDGEDGVGDAV
jgi:hypothetical protein